MLSTLALGQWSAVWGTTDGRGLLLGALAGAVPLAVILSLALFAGRLGQDIIAMSVGRLVGWPFVYRLAVQVALATVVCEELAFRGLLFVLFAHELPQALAIVVGAFVFGIWHLTLQYNGLVGQRGIARWLAALAGVLMYSALGCLLVLVRIAGGGLAAPLAAHGVLDLGMFIGLYLLRGRRAP
jgi:membrane protease YdiL (CAAX protease family)